LTNLDFIAIHFNFRFKLSLLLVLLILAFYIKTNGVEAGCSGSTQCCTKAAYKCNTWNIYGTCVKRDSFLSCVEYKTYNCGYVMYSGANRCAVICPHVMGGGTSGYL
jgi:hypothetical protein